MRLSAMALIGVLVVVATGGSGAAYVQGDEPRNGASPWAADPGGAQNLGFAPLTITQGGAAYAPLGEPSDTGGDTAVIADLPAWALSARETRDARDTTHVVGRSQFGDLPEPAAWALVLIGFALIGGAVRGLFMANRRLARLRSEESSD